MSAEENKDMIRRLYDLVYKTVISKNKVTLAMLREYIDDETLLQHFLASQEGFPYYWMECDELIAEGDMVAMRGWMRGTHLGTFMGIPPTGKEVKVPTYVTYRVIGGKIVDHWMMMDSAILMEQLGVSQPP